MKSILNIIILLIGLNIIATTFFCMFRDQFFKFDSIPEKYLILRKVETK